MVRPTLNLGHVLMLNRGAWENVPAIRHQITHIEQLMDLWYIGYLVMWPFSKRFRLRMDSDAYRIELACHVGGGREAARDRIALEMASRYGLSVARASGILSLSRGCPL